MVQTFTVTPTAATDYYNCIYTDAFGQLLNQYAARSAWVTASSTQTVVVCRQSSDCPILGFSHSPQITDWEFIS